MRNIRYFSFQHYKQVPSQQTMHFLNIYLKVCLLNNVLLDLIMGIQHIYKNYTLFIQFFTFTISFLCHFEFICKIFKEVLIIIIKINLLIAYFYLYITLFYSSTLPIPLTICCPHLSSISYSTHVLHLSFLFAFSFRYLVVFAAIFACYIYCSRDLEA